LNADDVRVAAMASRSAAAVVTYGSHAGGDGYLTGVPLDHLARPSFTAHTPWGTVDVRLGASGRHMASNAGAALAVAGTVGADLYAEAAALADVGLSPMRMQLVTTVSGGVIVNDCYNANPTS